MGGLINEWYGVVMVAIRGGTTAIGGEAAGTAAAVVGDVPGVEVRGGGRARGREREASFSGGSSGVVVALHTIGNEEQRFRRRYSM